MFKVIEKLSHIKMAVKTMLFSSVFLGTKVLAKMPDIQDPTQGKQTGYMSTVQAYVYDGAVFGGLLLVGICLFVAAKAILVEYNNISEGKGTWTKFVAFVVIGIILVVACIWLATLAAETLLN